MQDRSILNFDSLTKMLYDFCVQNHAGTFACFPLPSLPLLSIPTLSTENKNTGFLITGSKLIPNKSVASNRRSMHFLNFLYTQRIDQHSRDWTCSNVKHLLAKDNRDSCHSSVVTRLADSPLLCFLPSRRIASALYRNVVVSVDGSSPLTPATGSTDAPGYSRAIACKCANQKRENEQHQWQASRYYDHTVRTHVTRSSRINEVVPEAAADNQPNQRFCVERRA